MADKFYPKSNLPIRKTSDFLPEIFRTESNEKFLNGSFDAFVQPGSLEKITGYIGRRYGKTYRSSDVYIDDDESLRSRYQLEPAVVTKTNNQIENFYDYIDLRNQLKYLGNVSDRDDKTVAQTHYTWNPPLNWDKFINYREYYWEPLCPPPINVTGNSVNVTSTYKVNQGSGSTWILSPDGLTNNPTVILYRGQTYRFQINSPGEGFVIRSNYDTGSLLYNPQRSYQQRQLVIFDNKLWRAKANIPAGDGSSIDSNSQDWELVESIVSLSSFDYNNGVINNGSETGEIVFTVPYDAPDILFYQSSIDSDRLGQFIIENIEDNTFIDINKEILGKTSYTSSNGVEFTNGLVVNFTGRVFPETYASDSWIIEGVGESISLTRVLDLTIPRLDIRSPQVLFDAEGFDSLPFDDATAYPSEKDYVTIARNSKDSNPWSRYNRWFHRSVLEYTYRTRGEDFPADENLRAKRPIIEFEADLKLANHGVQSKKSVDFLDDFTKDVFSNIEGTTGYNVDGEFIFEGARILFIADTDQLVQNKIYRVTFITHNNRRQIHLIEESDSVSVDGECVLVTRGKVNGGSMFHYTTTDSRNTWVRSQAKLTVNQFPLFDIFDENGISFLDTDSYPISNFEGSTIFQYKLGNGIIDSELGFSLDYLNIDNIGDILFEWKLDTETFQYLKDREQRTALLASGFYKFNNSKNLQNGWIALDSTVANPIIDNVNISQETNSFTTDIIDWENTSDDKIEAISFYLNGKKIYPNFTRDRNIITLDRNLSAGDSIAIKLIGDVEPLRGYYEIPVGLEKNPLNVDLQSFTFGETVDHLISAFEFDQNLRGEIPGISNLRNLVSYRNKSKRFLKHSVPSPLSVFLVCNKKYNIVNAVRYAQKSYSEIKNNILQRAISLPLNENIPDFLDEIINDLSRIKSSESPFFSSDMIGSGAFTTVEYTVDDPGIKTFSLSFQFDLATLSNRAVYVYVNDVQLLHGKEYSFNSTFGFITLTVDLNETDRVVIKEYISTQNNFIPATPTKLGIYKKFVPKKFVDDRYLEPQEVIQGHDGSITVCFGDFRDDILLELEYRIYNNIKVDYDEAFYDIDQYIGGYYGGSKYSYSDINPIIEQDFLRWVSDTDIDYITNSYFDNSDSFTYTYSALLDPASRENLSGWWRGIYKNFYDTDRPHSHPWEMLGFTDEPDWWVSQYGPYPYTRNNLLLWEDLRDGIIRQGNRAGTYDRYKRETLLNHIPVDSNGRLLSPLESGLANNYLLYNTQGDFNFGDYGPVESAWRNSSQLPFSIVAALSLVNPFEFISVNFDKSILKENLIGQIVFKGNSKFLKLTDFDPQSDDIKIGLLNYLIDYSKSLSYGMQEFSSVVENIQVSLSSRIAGFVDQEQQKFLLDSKSPQSSTSSIFIPPENYDIIFNVSTPIERISYSGILIEKTDRGYLLRGYDKSIPYFNYYEAIPLQSDPVIIVGGVSPAFTEWISDKNYANGEIIRYREEFYKCLRSHTSEAEFNFTFWNKIPKLPITGGVEAAKRRNFKSNLSRLKYGTVLRTIQAVADFIWGYEHYLKSIGFQFNDYDSDLKVNKDFSTSLKEFMFWTKHNWAVGSLISLSPISQKIDVSLRSIGVAENLTDSFNEYQVLRADGSVVPLESINVNRQYRNITVSTADSLEGIYFLKIILVTKEHVVVFSDRTVFNDVIYQSNTGYRQERIKTLGFRTVDWDGDYTSPGFIFDNVNIAAWRPFSSYRLGDIVSYKSFYWTSKVNHISSEIFDVVNWTKLDLIPQKALLPNLDYKTNLISDYYEVIEDGAGLSQRELARHFLGYQSRKYLEDLAEDPLMQFQLYRGFIREKGTRNSIDKIFDKISRSDDDSQLEIQEEWALKTGNFGGVDQVDEFEIRLQKNQFLLNPQPVFYVNVLPQFPSDRYYRFDDTSFTIKPKTFDGDIFPVAYRDINELTPGYVRADQVKFVFKNLDALVGQDIDQFVEDDHVWITFDNSDWGVYRFVSVPVLYVIGIEQTTTSITLTFNRPHELNEGEIFATRIPFIKGFRKIDNVVSKRVISFNITSLLIPSAEVNDLIDSSLNPVWLLVNSRFSSYKDLAKSESALLPVSAKLWIDKGQQGLWDVVEKTRQYNFKKILDYGVGVPIKTGTKVLYDNRNNTIISSIPGSSTVMVYVESDRGLALKQIIEAPFDGYESIVQGTFGEQMAISPDSVWLVIASPKATPFHQYAGHFNPFATYDADDVVLYQGKLWRAKNNVAGDGSTINVYSLDWEPADIMRANPSIKYPGFNNQGFISVYKYRLGGAGNNVSQGVWDLETTIVSPRPSENEFFGSAISIGVSNGKYYMAVSATGASNETGRVYLFVYENGRWKMREDQNYRGIYRPQGPEFKVGTLIPGQQYTIATLDTTDFTTLGATSNFLGEQFTAISNGIVDAGNFIIGKEYVITDLGTTNWTSFGYNDIVAPAVGRTFVATGVGAGSGKATQGNGTVYSSEFYYPKNSIVFYDGELYQALTDFYPDNSTISLESNDWLRLNPVATNSSLPKSVSLENDGSSILPSGILTELQIAEIVKPGDKFGYSVAMNFDASILVVGAPFSDGLFIPNFKGPWRSDLEYTQDDVVKWQGRFYKLENLGPDAVPEDSNIKSYGQQPGEDIVWTNLDYQAPNNTGKIFVYKRNEYDIYELIQTLAVENLESWNDSTDSTETTIRVGDQFGFAIDIDSTGNLLLISSPKADLEYQDQGVVYILSKDTTEDTQFRIKQKLQSFERYPNEYFGNDICISPDTSKIVVAANNSQFRALNIFDSGATFFDNGTTRFFGEQGFVGATYVFEKKSDDYYLTEKLFADFQNLEGFGSSISCSNSVIAVGSPFFKQIIGGTLTEVGITRVFRKIPGSSSWNIIAQQEHEVDLQKISSISLFDDVKNQKLLDLDIFDPAKFKILGLAEQEIKFKTPYDPAIYNTAEDIESVIVDSEISWAESHVGEVWWDISKSKWLYYDQGDISYRLANWAKLAEGAEIVVAEWVESTITPQQWAITADTVEGLSRGISGQPLYQNVYTVKEILNPLTGNILERKYFFWVKDKVNIPDVPFRKLSTFGVRNLIENPPTDVVYAGLAGDRSIFFFNLEERIESQSVLVNVLVSKDHSRSNPIHNEYQIISEDAIDQEIPNNLELKWLNSLIGYDENGNRVPDPNLPDKQKYGVAIRPRQSMFINRFAISKIVIDRINRILKTQAFAETANLTSFLSKEEIPNRNLNLYDVEVDSNIDLINVGTVRVRRAILKANIVDGGIDTIDIIDRGFGYRVAPPVILDGDGIGAEAEVTIDNQGRINSAIVIQRGRKYSTVITQVRPFSVLVRSDRDQNDLWSIYGWDEDKRNFFRISSQSYDVTRFWNYEDWWADSKYATSKITTEILGAYQETLVQLEIGDLLRIQEYGNGGWAVLEKISNSGLDFFQRYRLVGRQLGTLQLSETLYDTEKSGVGFDNLLFFDTGLYDIENAKELRIMLNSIKEDFFVNDLSKEWRSLFFESLRYLLIEQGYVDWLFKTSFVKIKNNVGQLQQKINYKNDNLDSYVQYFNEVKPYRTTIRSFISSYQNNEVYSASSTDFDAPAYYDSSSGTVEVPNSTSSVLQNYPWKWWADFNYFTVDSIEVVDGGNNYTQPPSVLIQGNGTGASAKAYISNGKVVRVLVTNQGTNYTSAPIVILQGGNGSSPEIAKAIAILGNNNVRTLKTMLRFDRTSKEIFYSEIEKSERLVATGSSSVFNLKFPPSRNKNDITILRNDELVFSDQYNIDLYEVYNGTYTALRARLSFNIPLIAGDVIDIQYVLNDDILDNVNRIEKYYNPQYGMKSKDLDQLMTGIDYGGVKIQGTTFEVTGGWDALPWFTDTWDSVEASADYYVVVDGSTTSVTLPYVPANGQRINIYLKRRSIDIEDRNWEEIQQYISNLQLEPEKVDTPIIRIDDPNFDNNWDSGSAVNPNAEMPTFVGDGSTRVIEIGRYINTRDGDTLIFRLEESDGSVSIKDPNILDTLLTGGNLNYTGAGTETSRNTISGSYNSAVGTAAEEIQIDGEKFISPDQVPFPEEVIPGQVLDGVSFKVFGYIPTAPSPISFKVVLGNGNNRTFDIGLDIIENDNVIVYVDKIKKTLLTDYEINFITNQIVFVEAPADDAKVEIISFGLGGVSILDYQEFISDGETNLFLTGANFSQTVSVLVTVDGERIDIPAENSSDIIDVPNKTLVRFAEIPERNSVIKIICLGASFDADSTDLSIIRINQQSFVFDGSTRSLDLDRFVRLSRGSAVSSVVVEVNGNILKGVDTTSFVYDGTNGAVELGTDPVEPSGTVLPENVNVYINGVRRQLGSDFDYNAISKELVISSERVSINDRVVVEVDFRAEYNISENNLVIDSDFSIAEDDVISVTWFSEYPTLAIESDEYVGGKVNYQLKSIPINSSYVWVYLNGQRLTLDVDYKVSIPRGVIYLNSDTSEADRIRIIQFSSNSYVEPVGYEITKDVLNNYQYRRYNIDNTILANDVKYYDLEIELSDASNLYEPDASNNIPGIVSVNGEKIAYFSKIGNKISQLRRGYEGTSIPEIHVKGSSVINSSRNEILPYKEEQDKYSFVSDGSSLLIGPLSFIPSKITKSSWFKTSIPDAYGPCYELEIFVGGKRLKKDPIEIYDENLGVESPLSDKTIEAEFSVDGENPFVRLTSPAPAGTRITVVKRTGNTWYDYDGDQFSNSSLVKNQTAIAKFIAQRGTKLPE
jgi:hypothetical protein